MSPWALAHGQAEEVREGCASLLIAFVVPNRIWDLFSCTLMELLFLQSKPCLVERAAGTLGRGFLEELTTSWLLSFPLLARGAREDSVTQPGVCMHVPEGNVLHLPFMGHPNT